MADRMVEKVAVAIQESMNAQMANNGKCDFPTNASAALEAAERMVLVSREKLEMVLSQIHGWEYQLAWDELRALLDKPDSYYFLTMAAAQAGEISYISFPGLIDHVMITQDALAELNGGVTQPYRLDLTEPDYEWEVSDHLPVVTIFELK